MRDDSISTKLTKIIRDNLPDGVEGKLKKSFSSKSLRKGGISELAAHKDITMFDSIARTGHSLGNSQDHYCDRMHPFSGLAAGMALSGWSDIDGKMILPPRLSCLGSLSMVDAVRMMLHVFVVSLPEFKPNGVLFPLLLQITACLIMYYPHNVSNYGTQHILIVTIRNAAIRSQIRDANCSSPKKTLMYWAKKIKVDFEQQNHHLKTVSNESELIPALNSMNRMFGKLQKTMTTLVDR